MRKPKVQEKWKMLMHVVCNGAEAHLIHKLLLKGAVLTHVTHNLTDLGPLFSSLEGLTAAHSLPNILSSTLHKIKHTVMH